MLCACVLFSFYRLLGAYNFTIYTGCTLRKLASDAVLRVKCCWQIAV